MNFLEVYLNEIETAVPTSDGHQRYIDFLPHLISDQRNLKLVSRLASKSQIEHRYSVLHETDEVGRLDAEGLFVPGRFASTATRMKVYEENALPLAVRAVAPILERTPSASITHLIVTSCTGFFAPGLDLQLQRHFNLASSLERTVVGFMGCYAGISALKSASHIVRSNPEARVLIVNLELCSLHLQDESDPERVLGALQFADGCAASLVSREERGLKLLRFRGEALFENSEMIRWSVGNTGFEMILSADLPRALGQVLPRVMPKIMTAEERARLRLWAIHPGGRSILDVAQSRLELTDLEIRPSREVLRDYGNMSSATIMFVLKRFLGGEEFVGLGAALAFGPGLTVESMMFSKGDEHAVA